MRILLVALIVLGMTGLTQALAQEKAPRANPQINYVGFRDLAREVEPYRQGRLVDLATFQRMASEPNTIVLDARSVAAFTQGHISGAINLPFTDFTDESLRAALRDPNVRILIYCNNNFSDNAQPVVLKRLELALNIQTFINLYGYGYRNVYELNEVVATTDPAVRWVRG